MTIYQPDMWVIVKITNKEDIFYKVFGTWLGGYLTGDSWRINSGIVGVKEENDFFYFDGESGSTYVCHKDAYGCSGYSQGILQTMVEGAQKKGSIAEVLEGNTNFSSLLLKS